MIAALAVELYVAANHLDDIVFLFKGVEKFLVYTLFFVHGYTPPIEKVDGMNRLSKTLIA